jgi:pimeloyl-ACP methyl ester carboxylesterase
MPLPPTSSPPDYLARFDGHRVAYRRAAGQAGKVGFVWLGGFRSDMEGSKALTLEAWARGDERPFVRFDYFGHGASDGGFTDGTITRWREDALAVVDALTEGPQVLVGSSMGGWIALLAALARPDRVAGLLLIAPAADFTERLIWRQLPEETRRTILEQGVHHLPGGDGFEPTPIARALIEDGRNHLLYDAATIPIPAPVKIVQGLKDPDVPWRHALELVARLDSRDVEFIRIEDGDHRLSTPTDLARLVRVAAALAAQVDPPKANDDATVKPPEQRS